MTQKNEYYKVVTYRGQFARTYCSESLVNDGFSIQSSKIFQGSPLDITPGEKFHALDSEPGYKYPWDSNTMISRSVLHFAEGAFNTMLWYSCFVTGPEKESIYNISPLTSAEKQQCPDLLGFYQCGAYEIEIIAKMNVDSMYDMAIAEFYENQGKKNELYPYLPLDKIIASWERHQPFNFGLYCQRKTILSNIQK